MTDVVLTIVRFPTPIFSVVNGEECFCIGECGEFLAFEPIGGSEMFFLLKKTSATLDLAGRTVH